MTVTELMSEFQSHYVIFYENRVVCPVVFLDYVFIHLMAENAGWDAGIARQCDLTHYLLLFAVNPGAPFIFISAYCS